MRPIDVDPILEWSRDPEQNLPYGPNGVDFEQKLKNAPVIKTKQVKYFDEDENVWKVGEVIVDE